MMLHAWQHSLLITKPSWTHPGTSVRTFLDATRLIVLGPDDQAHWDHFIANAPNGHLLQCWAWGELKRAFGWLPLRIALWEPASRQILAGAQVLLRPLPVIGSSLAYIPKGPVIDWSDAALVELFLAGLHSFLRSQRAAVLRVEPDVPKQDDDLAHRLSNIGFRPVEDHIQQLRTIIVDLTPDEETIRQRQKPKWRYNTNLAARKGVTVRPASNLNDLQRWYDLFETTRERDGFESRSFAYFRQLWDLLRPAGQAQLFLAEHERTLLAGILVTRVGRQSIYLYGASGNEKRHLMPNHLLQWEAMRWARSQGATSYDLWGIAETDAPDDPLAGVTQFKQGWGGHVVEYPGAFDYIYAPLAYRLFLAGRKLMRQITAARASLARKRAAD